MAIKVIVKCNKSLYYPSGGWRKSEEVKVSNYNRFIDNNILVLQEYIVIPQSWKAHPVPIKFLWESEFIS